MEINTKHFGIIDIEESGIITFPEGLPGFENLRKFVLLNKAENDIPFQWLQSIDDFDLAFVVIDPYAIVGNYDIDIDDNEIEVLEIADINKILIYSIVVVPENIKDMTANLKAPIIINTENMKGKQVVLNDTKYQLRYRILEGVQKTGGK